MTSGAFTKKGQRPGTKQFYEQLPRELVLRSNARRVFASILGTLFVVLAINFATVWYLGRYPQNRGYWLIKEKWNLLLSLEAPVDWLILGDSSGNQGVISDMLGRLLSGSAVNLCTTGDMMLVDDSWMLQTHIDRLGPPKNLLLVHAYDNWKREMPPVVTLSQIPISWNTMSRLVPQLPMRNQDKIAMAAAQYIPLYAETSGLKKIVKAPGKLFRKQFYLNPDGFMPYRGRAQPRRVEKDKKRHVEFLENNEFVVSDANRAGFQRIIEVAEQHGINVYLVNSPVYEGLYKEQCFQSYYERVRRYLREHASQSPNVHHLDFVQTFPSHQMENVDHVTLPAAEIYTRALVSQIRRVVSPPDRQEETQDPV